MGWLDKYKDGGDIPTELPEVTVYGKKSTDSSNKELDPQFGNLHLNSTFTPARFNLGKAGSVSGSFKVPGKSGFGALPFLDLATGLIQIMGDEIDVQKSENPEHQRKLNYYKNLNNANQLTPIQKMEYEMMTTEYKNGGNLQENNPNNEKVSFPPNFKGQGTLDTGFDYNSAWGGSFQNGGEMKYYQEGLDFKPKNISKNGSELTKLDQLTNFTNYNKPTAGGWLSKYE